MSTRPVFRCNDGNAEIDITADTAADAATAYVDGGDWNVDTGTVFITVYTEEILGTDEDGDELLGDRESHTIAVEPTEPECSGGEHDWQSPHRIVGGLRENPGVRAHGGGVIIEEVCVHCGCAKVTDTWAQNPSNGVQGLRSTAYHPSRYADEVAELAEQ